HFAPSPFTEETDATGLSILAPMNGVRPEDATSASGDLTWRKVPFEVTTTVFHSNISRAQVFRPLASGPYAARAVNAETPTRTSGRSYLIIGLLYTRNIGPALLYINGEDLTDVRQTKYDPLLRLAPLRDERWATDEWAPIEGRSLNAGLRFRF